MSQYSSPATPPSPPNELEGKKILYLDSYHEGYEWSDEITAGIRSVLEGSGVELKIVRMDTKQHPEEEFKKSAGEMAKKEIEAFDPDVLIVSDDIAFQYAIMPYFRDADLPIVFCGLNWDAALYGAPYSNMTGMVEVSLTTQLIDTLKKYGKGDHIGYLSADTETERKNAFFYEKLFHIEFSRIDYVTTMAEWETAYALMQDEVDILLFENNAGIADWDEDRAKAFALDHARIPIGTTNPWIMPTALIGLVKIPEEQGEWSALRALDILRGAKPSDIPVTANERGRVMLNFTMADTIGAVFSPELVKNAEIVR